MVKDLSIGTRFLSCEIFSMEKTDGLSGADAQGSPYDYACVADEIQSLVPYCSTGQTSSERGDASKSMMTRKKETFLLCDYYLTEKLITVLDEKITVEDQRAVYGGNSIREIILYLINPYTETGTHTKVLGAWDDDDRTHTGAPPKSDFLNKVPVRSSIHGEKLGLYKTFFKSITDFRQSMLQHTHFRCAQGDKTVPNEGIQKHKDNDESSLSKLTKASSQLDAVDLGAVMGKTKTGGSGESDASSATTPATEGTGVASASTATLGNEGETNQQAQTGRKRQRDKPPPGPPVASSAPSLTTTVTPPQPFSSSLGPAEPLAKRARPDEYTPLPPLSSSTPLPSIPIGTPVASTATSATSAYQRPRNLIALTKETNFELTRSDKMIIHVALSFYKDAIDSCMNKFLAK